MEKVASAINKKGVNIARWKSNNNDPQGGQQQHLMVRALIAF